MKIITQVYSAFMLLTIAVVLLVERTLMRCLPADDDMEDITP